MASASIHDCSNLAKSPVSLRSAVHDLGGGRKTTQEKCRSEGGGAHEAEVAATPSPSLDTAYPPQDKAAASCFVLLAEESS